MASTGRNRMCTARIVFAAILVLTAFAATKVLYEAPE